MVLLSTFRKDNSYYVCLGLADEVIVKTLFGDKEKYTNNEYESKGVRQP